MVLWRKPRNPPSVNACALDPGMDAIAAARSKLRSRLPFTAIHRTVHRPQHLHGSSPSTLDARVPANKDQAHDHTARLTIHSSQSGVSTTHSSYHAHNKPPYDHASLSLHGEKIIPCNGNRKMAGVAWAGGQGDTKRDGSQHGRWYTVGQTRKATLPKGMGA